jgi:hypothetical protein
LSYSRKIIRATTQLIKAENVLGVAPDARHNAGVRGARFASVDDAMAPEGNASTPGLGSIRAMRDADDELDEIVADAYRKRREETWRDFSVE